MELGHFRNCPIFVHKITCRENENRFFEKSKLDIRILKQRMSLFDQKTQSYIYRILFLHLLGSKKIFEIVTFFFNGPPPLFFGDFRQSSKYHKNRSKNDKRMIGTVLESWRSILFENQICINKIEFVDANLGQNGTVIPESGFWPENWSLPFGLQKGPNSKYFLRNRKHDF